jgi:hypothetical protein
MIETLEVIVSIPILVALAIGDMIMTLLRRTRS